MVSSREVQTVGVETRKAQELKAFRSRTRNSEKISRGGAELG